MACNGLKLSQAVQAVVRVTERRRGHERYTGQPRLGASSNESVLGLLQGFQQALEVARRAQGVARRRLERLYIGRRQRQRSRQTQ